MVGDCQLNHPRCEGLWEADLGASLDDLPDHHSRLAGHYFDDLPPYSSMLHLDEKLFSGQRWRILYETADGPYSLLPPHGHERPHSPKWNHYLPFGSRDGVLVDDLVEFRYGHRDHRSRL